MAELGFDYSVDWVIDRSTPDLLTQPFGPGDVDIAERFGYGIGPARRKPGKIDPNAAYLSGLTAQQRVDFTVALFGTAANQVHAAAGDGTIISTNRDGCLSAARTELYGNLDRWFKLDVWGSGLDQQVLPKVYNSTAYAGALRQWVSCMSRSAQATTDPQTSRAEVGALYDKVPYDQAWAAERARAVADARCSEESGLRAVAERQYRKAVREIEKLRPDDFADYRALLTAAADRARELLRELTMETTAKGIP